MTSCPAITNCNLPETHGIPGDTIFNDSHRGKAAAAPNQSFLYYHISSGSPHKPPGGRINFDAQVLPELQELKYHIPIILTDHRIPVAERFKSILSSSVELYALTTQAKTLANLQRQFASIAPPYLAQCSQVTSLHDGRLGIVASNATVAAKLRQLAPELIAMLNDKGCTVSEIRVKVQVAYFLSPTTSKPRLLGTVARNALQQFSQSLDDSPLKRAVERMARRKN